MVSSNDGGNNGDGKVNGNDRRETYWQHAAAMTMIILLEVISEEVEVEIETDIDK